MTMNYRGSKYHAKKVRDLDGNSYDSKKEYRRYRELQLLERAGQITNLRRQVKFVLIPAQREPEQSGPRGGRKPGTLIEREVAYYADFAYEVNGNTVVEDCKGVRTPEYRIKKKLMLWVHGIRILET